MKKITVLLLIILFMACGKNKYTTESINDSLIDFTFQLAEAQSGQPDQIYMDAMYQNIQDYLTKIDDVNLLKKHFDLTYRLQIDEVTAHEKKEWNIRASRINKLNLAVPPLFITSESCISRIGKIGNDAAAKALMEIYQNPKYSFDGESALNLLCAMKSCGEPLLTYLENKKENAFIQSAIECIVNDKPCI